MEPITLAVALVASALAWRARPPGALSIFLAVLCWYPQFLTVKVGTVDLSVGRIVIFVVLANGIVRTSALRRFRGNLLDCFVCVAFLGQCFALSLNEPLMKVLEREGGTLVDTLLPYFAIRLMVTTREDLVALVKGLVVVALPLALVGAYQSVTGHNPFGFMKGYAAWAPGEQVLLRRHGLFRADATFKNYISFGLFFAGAFPLCIALWRSAGPNRRPALAVAAGVVLMGVVSSMSSAPFFALAVCIMFMCGFPFRRFWPPLVLFLIACIVFLEFYSNRHFYHVLTRFAFNSETAYYRIGLFDEAFGGGMQGHWLTGYGYVGFMADELKPGFNWFHKDLVNIYIARLARFGLTGLLPYLGVNVLYYRRLYRAAGQAPDPGDQWWIWCIAATLVGWNVAMMTTNVLAQLEPLMYMFIGMAGNAPLVFGSETRAEAPDLDEGAWRPSDCALI